MATAWSDDEYGRVARALLYPTFRKTVVLIGYGKATDQLGYSMDAKLQSVTPSVKLDILTLADSIVSKEQDLFDSIDCGPDVTRVGDISKNSGMGVTVRNRVLMQMRYRLAEMFDHYPNPVALATADSGGINASVSD